MKTKKHDTRWMGSVALMAAIVIVLANTPLGMIQLPIIKATTVHIPVQEQFLEQFLVYALWSVIQWLRHCYPLHFHHF